MKTIIKFLILIAIISFAAKLWLNIELKKSMDYIKKENIENLEFNTNKNFNQFGIENMG